MSSKSAATSESLLDELQTTLAHGTVARRVETLRRVTDLFINGAVDYSDEQIGLFDDVFQCLMEHIETSAKALLANRLAPINTAPPLTIRTLAFDDLIEVAAPVLSGSERLDDDALIETARNKSQAHLLAISTAQGAERRGDRRAGAARQRRGDPEHRQQSRRGILRARLHPAGQSRRGRRQSRDLPRHAADDPAASLSETDRQGLGDGAGAARGRQPAAGRRRADRGAGGDAARALRALGDQPGNRDRPRAGQVAVRGRPARRASGGGVCRGRQIRRDQCGDRSARQRVGVDRREHDGGNPRRGRHDPGQGRGDVVVDGQGDHQHARRALGNGADRSRGLQGHLRAAAASTAQQVLRFHRMQQTAPSAA